MCCACSELGAMRAYARAASSPFDARAKDRRRRESDSAPRQGDSAARGTRGRHTTRRRGRGGSIRRTRRHAPRRASSRARRMPVPRDRSDRPRQPLASSRRRRVCAQPPGVDEEGLDGRAIPAFARVFAFARRDARSAPNRASVARAAGRSSSDQSMWLNVSASSQYAIAKLGSRCWAERNAREAAS